MKQARIRTAGNTLLMRIASNLSIQMAAPGWPFSCNTEIKVTMAELASPAHVNTQFASESFGICRFRGLCIGSLKITVTQAVCTWRCWTLPLLRFERERMQLGFEIILLNKIWRNHLLSENLQWNYASFNVTLIYLMHDDRILLDIFFDSTTERKNIVKLLAISQTRQFQLSFEASFSFFSLPESPPRDLQITAYK